MLELYAPQTAFLIILRGSTIDLLQTHAMLNGSRVVICSIQDHFSWSIYHFTVFSCL